MTRAITEDGLEWMHIEIGKRVATALEKALLVPLRYVVIVSCRRHRNMKDNTVNVRYRVRPRVSARYPQNLDVIGAEESGSRDPSGSSAVVLDFGQRDVVAL